MTDFVPHDDQHDESSFRNLLALADGMPPEPPSELVERVRQRLQAKASPGRSKRSSGQKLARSFWIATAALAVLLLAPLATYLLPRQASWAQVASAVRAKPWVHFTYPSDDGAVHEEWFSFSRELSARRDGDEISFQDQRLKVMDIYHPKERKILRVPTTSREWERQTHQALDRVLQGIFRGAEKLEFPLPEVELVEQKRTEVEKRGRKWLSYELTLRHAAEQKQETWKMTFLVDPATNLPQVLVMTNTDGKKGPREMSIEITYPDPGPADIYGAGAPRDAKFENKLPANDVQRLITGVNASAERFDDYIALTINSQVDSPWYAGTPQVYWRHGAKTREVIGYLDPDAPAPPTPADGVNQQQWWKQRWRKLIHVPGDVHDGKVLWTNDAQPKRVNELTNYHPRSIPRSETRQPSWRRNQDFKEMRHGMPLFLAYLKLRVEHPWEAEVDSQPADGPPNTVLLTIRTTTPGNISMEDRLWIDQERSYMIVRREYRTRDLSKTPPVETLNHTHYVETSERSPRGIWYPTRMRFHMHALENGQELGYDAVTRHYLEFPTTFSDDLFRPMDRLGEPLE